MRISDWSSDVCSSDLTSLVRQSINTGATPILQLPTGAGTSIPFVLFQAGGRQDREYITNEFQILGDFEGFDIIVGAFYNNDRPHGPSGNGFKAFQPAAAPTPNVTAHSDNRNFAVRSEARSEGKECVGPGRFQWWEAI